MRPIYRFWKHRKLPILLQIEAAECGLCCLAMVASFFGRTIDLANMRKRFSVSLKGTSLSYLITVANKLGLSARPLRLSMKNIEQLNIPCVLHWDMNHFVVLKKIQNQNVKIHDPAVGERILPLREVANHFTGIALELVPGPNFKCSVNIQQFSLLSLMGKVEGLERGLCQLLILGICLQLCLLVLPFYLQWIVDEALVSADHDLVAVLAIGFLLLVIVQALIGGVRSWATTVLATRLNFQWLGNSFAHLMHLPISWFETRHLGDVVSRFSSIQTIQHSITTQFVEGIVDGILVLTTLGVMLFYSAKLAALSVIAVIIYILLRWVIFRELKSATAEQIIHAAKQQSQFLESARGVQSVRLFGRQDVRRISWINTLAEQFNADIRIARVTIIFQVGNTLLFSLERVIVIWLAALEVIESHFSVGMLCAFVSYKDQFSQRIASLVDKLFDFSMLRLHGERVADILLTDREREDIDIEVDIKNIQPSISISGISFRYSDDEPNVLTDLNLFITSGECIAITGASGCGKSTLIKILLGLLEPTSGEIMVGGMKLHHIGLNNYRKLVGTVMQDDQLFSGSIAENISFFDILLDQKKIEWSSKLAAIHSEISAMPMGYNTLIGDIGSGLSGGQKQRILLARALYKQPRILVLDEATSHLDIQNEGLVSNAIRSMNMTRILVAHRPETIATADRVVYLEGGRFRS
jgi:ATP-binding cassette subfamily B protein RaxB